MGIFPSSPYPYTCTPVCTYQWGLSRNINQHLTGLSPHLHSSGPHLQPSSVTSLHLGVPDDIVSHGLFHFSYCCPLPLHFAHCNILRKQNGWHRELLNKHLLSCSVNKKEHVLRVSQLLVLFLKILLSQ